MGSSDVCTTTDSSLLSLVWDAGIRLITTIYYPNYGDLTTTADVLVEYTILLPVYVVGILMVVLAFSSVE